MTYQQELNDLRRELIKSEATTLSWWPKVLGQNVDVSSTPSDNTFTVHKPDGTEIQGTTNASRVVITPDARLDMAVNAIADLDEDYQVRLTWKETGGTVHKELLHFDVVLVPFGPPSISLSALREERPDIADYLVRFYRKILPAGAASTDEERAEVAAGIYAVRARVELDALIRAQINEDAQQAVSSYEHADTEQTRFTRPRLILNRERLNRVERKIAMKLIFAADAKDPEDGSEDSAALFRHFRGEANTAWKSIGPLRYDTDDDLVPDRTIEAVSTVTMIERV